MRILHSHFNWLDSAKQFIHSKHCHTIAPDIDRIFKLEKIDAIAWMPGSYKGFEVIKEIEQHNQVTMIDQSSRQDLIACALSVSDSIVVVKVPAVLLQEFSSAVAPAASKSSKV